MNTVFALALVVVVTSMLASWELSRSRVKPAQFWTALAAAVSVCLNTLLGLSDDRNAGMLLFNFLALWQIATNVRALLRGS
jgi:hypothetical protein